MPVQTVIQPRRGTAAAWTTANPVLAAGEIGFETDTLKKKVGDGTTLWNALAYEGADKANVSHTHTVSQLSDASQIGKDILQDATAADVRVTIGAGTSNLALGTTSTTAMRGDKTFAFSEITGLIATAQLPPIAITNTYPVASQAAMLALVAERGDVAIRSDNGRSYILSTDNPGTLADWLEIVTANAVSSVAGRTGAVVLTKSDVGLSNVDNTSDASKPVSSATQTALNAKENTIAAGLTSQYYRGDKTWQTLDKTAVGLANVDNTSDASKPVSTAQAAAIAAKEPTIAAGTTAQYYRGDKTWQTLNSTAVGLANVNNTSDASKPVSTAQQAALDLKANLASPAFTGTPSFTGVTGVTGLTKAHVGLGNVDNTSDASKPISSATQTALNGKANSTHTHTSVDILSIDGGTP